MEYTTFVHPLLVPNLYSVSKTVQATDSKNTEHTTFNAFSVNSKNQTLTNPSTDCTHSLVSFKVGNAQFMCLLNIRFPVPTFASFDAHSVLSYNPTLLRTRGYSTITAIADTFGAYFHSYLILTSDRVQSQTIVSYSRILWGAQTKNTFPPIQTTSLHRFILLPSRYTCAHTTKFHIDKHRSLLSNHHFAYAHKQ